MSKQKLSCGRKLIEWEMVLNTIYKALKRTYAYNPCLSYLSLQQVTSILLLSCLETKNSCYRIIVRYFVYVPSHESRELLGEEHMLFAKKTTLREGYATKQVPNLAISPTKYSEAHFCSLNKMLCSISEFFRTRCLSCNYNSELSIPSPLYLSIENLCSLYSRTGEHSPSIDAIVPNDNSYASFTEETL